MVALLSANSGPGKSVDFTATKYGAHPIYEGLYNSKDDECFHLMLDTVCVDYFRKCRNDDCATPSDTCFNEIIMTSVLKLVECIKKTCVEKNKSGCNEIGVANAGEFLHLFYTKFAVQVTPYVKKSLVEALKFLFANVARRFEQVALRRARSSTNTDVGVDQCEDWTIDLSIKLPTGDHKYASTNLTCNPNQKEFQKTIEKNSLNSGALLASVLVYFVFATMTLGSNYSKYHFHLTAVRFGCFVAAIFMGSLVYIGAVHLQRSAMTNPVQSSRVNQNIWRSVYLLVSYLCFHGGLMVIAPLKGTVKRAAVTGAATPTEEISEDEGSCCPCCYDRFCPTLEYFKYYLKFFKEDFWDATGKHFVLKLAFMEFLEIALQLQSLTTSATTSHVQEVSLSAQIIAANFIVLPLMILAAPILCSRWLHHKSLLVAAVMVVEVLFDKMYVAIGVILRFNTLTDRNMSFMDQLSVHGALLVPAMMTALDVDDALNLSERVWVRSFRREHGSRNMKQSMKQSSDTQSTVLDDGTWRSKNIKQSIKRSSSDTRSTIRVVDEIMVHPLFRALRVIVLVSSILVGLGLGIYTQVAVDNAKRNCQQKIGSIASCAEQKYYFANGFFSQTTCAFDKVEKFVCSAEGGQMALNPGTRMLKDAYEEYATMILLTSINVSGSSLERAPKGWSRVPSQLSIDMSNSAKMSDLPFVLCSSAVNLTSINFHGTPASKLLNWSGQLLESNLMKFQGNRISTACEEELVKLPELKTLLLANNGITTNDLLRRGNLGSTLAKLTKIIHLDLRNNSIEKMEIDVVESVLRPVVKRFVDNNITEDDMSLLLAGNDNLKVFEIEGVGRKYTSEWINVVCGASHVVKIKIIACGWSLNAVRTFSQCISSVEELTIMASPGNTFNDRSVKVLSAGISQSKNLKYLSLMGNLLGDDGAVALADALQKTNIMNIELVNNCIGCRGSMALAAAVPNSVIQEIVLWDNPSFEWCFTPFNVTLWLDLREKIYLFKNVNGISPVFSIHNTKSEFGKFSKCGHGFKNYEGKI